MARFHFRSTCLDSLAAVLPPERLSSTEIERRLEPLYRRLRLPEGRLELMTGIRERRVWPVGTRPSDASAAAGRAVLARSAIPADAVELFIHAAVCRDMLEPATAAFAHRKIGLPPGAQIFDLSNACLGFLNALTVAGGLIESGQIRCALVVAGENGRPLVDETIRHLATAPLTRDQIKPYFANLTIGSGAVGALVCHRDLAPHGHRLHSGVARSATAHSELCQGDTHGADALAMQTDSERLLEAGVALAAETWAEFREVSGRGADGFSHFVCHQVGSVHRRRLYERLGLPIDRDVSTFAEYGNMGSVSLPATLATAESAGAIAAGSHVGLLGIGSGLNCLMLDLEW